MDKKFVSFVVYLHNEEKYIEGFLDKLTGFASENFENKEFVFVNDCCDDGTLKILTDFVRDHQLDSLVSIVHMGFAQGLEASMNAGRDAAIGDFVFEFDDVLIDFDTDEIAKVYQKSLEGYDIVSARGDGKVRFTSRMFYDLYNRYSHGNGKIGPEKFRLLSRRAINRIRSMGKYIPYRKAVYANCGLATAVVEYASKGTEVRKRKFRERSSLAIDSFIFFTGILEKISAVVSGIFLVITVGVGIYIITDIFNVNKPVEGWVSTMAFLAFGFFGVFALITIVLKYLSVLLNLEFKQQRYIVSDIEKVIGK